MEALGCRGIPRIMSVYFDKRNKRYRYKFERTVRGRIVTATKLLPRGWGKNEAQDFDTRETARLYALATGAKSEPLIEDAVLKWLTEAELKHRREYSMRLAADYEHYAGKTIAQIGEVFTAICQLDLADATKRNRCAYLMAACRFYDKRSVPDVRLPSVNNDRHNYIGRHEMLEIASKCGRVDVRAYIRIAFYSGMRVGEILKCTVRNGKFWLIDTKNKDPRIVPIHPKVLSAAEKYLPPKIVKRTIAKWWMMARDAAGYEHLHFHDLRHSSASAMINSGVDLYTVGAVLGHRDVRSTKRYAHLSTDTLDKAIRKIG